jgi:hypothetical protein
VTRLRAGRSEFDFRHGQGFFRISWTIRFLGFDSRRGPGIFLFTTAFRTALGPAQFPIQWIIGAPSLGIKRPGREADHSPTSSAEIKECVELYLHSPIRFHGVVLSLKSTGTALPLPLPGIFSRYSVQTESGAQPAYYPKGN